MQVSDSLLLPDGLERARSAGELVIFAGAGVSMGAPANLPNFIDLAREIAEPVVPWHERYETQVDRYLGIAKRAGVLVQERARENLIARGGSHTPLHEHLVGIFTSADRVRLITTNFDGFLSEALEAVFPRSGIPVYIGPALPPGAAFRGVVYLHGALSAPHDNLVLTDGDFGSAYLAEGWAARFLVPVFAQRTVLFVGYSLRDPVMQYLMQALPRTQRWYALCHESERDDWADKGIIPVTFQVSAGGDRYGDLNAGLQRWRSYAQKTPLDHDQELRRLVALGPPASREDADYIRQRLLTDNGRHSFWDAASDDRWFYWAIEEGLLDCLTDENTRVEQIGEWSQWVLEYFSGGESPGLLKFLRRRSLTLHRQFARALSLHMWRCKSMPTKAVIRQFIALIVNQPTSPTQRFDHYSWLLKKLVNDGYTAEAMALLAWLTRVRLAEIESLQLSYENEESDSGTEVSLPALSNRISIAGAPADLADYFDRDGKELASIAAPLLLRLGTERLQEAYDLLDLARADEEAIDWLNYGRTAIAPSNQDSYAHAEDILILMVRSALDHFSEVSPESLQDFADQKSNSKRLLLRRLALYAYAMHATIDADALLEKAAAEGWANEFWLRPELYLVLTAHYGRATEQAKKRYIAALPAPSEQEQQEDEYAGHARFGLSKKLQRLSPASAATVAFAEEEARLHGDWREGDVDGFLTRMEVGWGSDEVSPISADDMLSWTGDEVVSRVTAELVNTKRHFGSALLGAVQQAARTSATWAMDVCVAAIKAHNGNDALLDALAWGVRDAAFTPEEQTSFLEVWLASDLPPSIANSLGSLIDKWARELKPDASAALLDALDAVADKIYAVAKTIEPGVSDSGWVERAINHPAGHAAQVWWSVANARDKVDGNFVLTLDDAEKKRWEMALQDPSAAGAFARPIIGMATDRLGAGDFPWAQKELFPVFDALSQTDRAAQLWDGRLTQSRWSSATLLALEPYIPSLLQKSASLVPARSRELGDFVAMLVANHEKSNFSINRLHEFVHHSTLEARVAFADSLPRHLQRLTPKGRDAAWTMILEPYWRDRRTNVPVALADEEVGEMVSWVVALPENASQVLDELNHTPCGPLPHADSLLWQWREDDAWPREHPKDVVGIVGFLARSESIEQWSADDAVNVLEIALAAGAAKDEVQAAAEAVAAGTGSKAASALVTRLRC